LANLSQKCSGGTVTTSGTGCSGIGMTNLTFNPEDRLTSVTLGSVTETYAYDSQGRCISKTASGDSYWFIPTGSGSWRSD